MTRTPIRGARYLPASLVRPLTLAAALAVHAVGQALALPPRDPWLLWPQCAVLLAWLASPALRLATYHPWADGSWHGYVRGVAVGVVAAAVTWCLVRAQTHARSLVPWLAALAVLVPGDIVHYLRLHHPTVTSGGAVVADDFDAARSGGPPAPGRWLLELHGGAAASVQGGWLQFVNPPGAAGFAHLRMPRRTARVEREFWLPVGVPTEAFDETLEWRALVARQNEFYIVVEAKDFLLQATHYGLHVTYPDMDGRLTESHVEAPAVNDAQAHRYRLERGSHVIRLRLDGQEVWARPQAGPFEFVRFGETRSDAYHGGTMRLDDVRYTQRWRTD